MWRNWPTSTRRAARSGRAGKWRWAPRKTPMKVLPPLRMRLWRRWVDARRPCRSSRAVVERCGNRCFMVCVCCRGFAMRVCQAAHCPSPVLQACRAAERRKARRAPTQYLCLHLWPSNSTACCSQTHRMTRWGEGVLQGLQRSGVYWDWDPNHVHSL